MSKKSLLLITILLLTPIAEAIDISAHGYYRTRSSFFQDLDAQRPNTAAGGTNNSRFGFISYNQMRLRIEPAVKLNDFLSVHSSFDFLDNIVFGSNATDELEVISPFVGTITLPAGAGSLSTVGGTAGENGAINVRRAWLDILTPVGKFRLGRQPSHWGLGIFQNDGNDRQGDFGDSADRILFISQAPVGDGGLSFGALWDIAYEAQRDPRIGGLVSAIAENGQDTNQFAGFLLYDEADYSLGFFGGIRKRSGSSGSIETATDSSGVTHNVGIDGDTMLYFLDLYGRYEPNEVYSFGLEYVMLTGKISTGVTTGPFAFDGVTGSSEFIQLPANQTMRAQIAAIEAEGHYDFGGEWLFKGGFAQGDATPLSTRITQYGFRPDYQVALLMFNEPLGTSPTLRNASDSSRVTGGVPITGNFINNAYYSAITYRHHFDIRRAIPQSNDFSLGVRAVTAFAHKNPVNLNFSSLLTTTGSTLPNLVGEGKWYGAEVDLLLDAEFFDHLHTGAEFGFLLPGSAYDINVQQVPLGSVISTIAKDSANYAYGARFTVMAEF